MTAETTAQATAETTAQMTAETTAQATADAAEETLLLRVLSALLREDVVGLRSRGSIVDRRDGRWVRLPVPASGPTRCVGADALLLPVTEDGFQSSYAARSPVLLRESDGVQLTTIDEIVTALSVLADPVDRDGFAAFAAECRQTLATMRLHATAHDEVMDRLTTRYGSEPADWTGADASVAHDTLAAFLDHPVYPTARGRCGLAEEQLRAYAPEFHPRFALRWIALPRQALTAAGALSGLGSSGGPTDAAPGAAASDTGPDATAVPLPAWWPSPTDLGLSGLDADHVALPVHPLSVGDPLREALRAAGLTGRAVPAERRYLEVRPTLSMRTVAPVTDRMHHLKLPLATATLGLRNRRTIKPGTLADGAVVQRLLATVIAREPRFRDCVLLADESGYVHAGHDMLAVLLRRHPAGLDGAVTVPMAALLSRAPGGRQLIDHLADRFSGGSPLALLDGCWRLLFDWQTTLFGYGIALESHQQNISLVLDDRAGRPRLRLLLKDNDGPRINTGRLTRTLGPHAPGPANFADARICGASDGQLADLFTTITVHLCAGAYAFGLAGPGRVWPAESLRLVRERLAEAIERLGTGPGEPGAVLRARVLDAARLPIKAMVTAGTLLSKERSGAADINKHYATGPNYLRRERDQL
jgi:siderophore synthetase component